MSSNFTLPTSLRIGVLRGGPSSEYDVSLQTGASILNVLQDTHAPVDIFVSKDGKWHLNGIERNPGRVLSSVDVVFNAMHGKYGEDGQVQELLETHGVPYTGSTRFPSMTAMNKWHTKEILKKHNIKTPIGILVKQSDHLLQKAKQIWGEIPHPMIVKPTCGGSSLGIVVAHSFQELLSALETTLAEHGSVLVEEYIKGKEATCAVIDNFRNKDFYTLPPIEIVSANSVFDYDAKYSGKSREICPGNFTKEEKMEIERLAELTHKALGLRHYSRSDFIVHPKRGIYFLEVNSLPGLSRDSLLSKSLTAVGSNIKEFLHHVLNLTLHRRAV
ncbi:MAG: D-alanine--D-alanine ligase [Patescibacteria group bacterium]